QALPGPQLGSGATPPRRIAHGVPGPARERAEPGAAIGRPRCPARARHPRPSRTRGTRPGEKGGENAVPQPWRTGEDPSDSDPLPEWFSGSGAGALDLSLPLLYNGVYPSKGMGSDESEERVAKDTSWTLLSTAVN